MIRRFGSIDDVDDLRATVKGKYVRYSNYKKVAEALADLVLRAGGCGGDADLRRSVYRASKLLKRFGVR